ncbi:CtrA inhibitor SciP [Shumkonia mesophila]|uniref:CtrA inhibitor SciP n=1 Tax=Shumkonia mesophila TaxID=2838854 RepID=UPI0029343562|nr:DUF1153 domain-containing protein [Shumkonia mesophila]
MNQALATPRSLRPVPSPAAPAARTLTLDDLPPPDTGRWVRRRKADVVAGVRAGLISLDEACRRYALSIEEFLSWERLCDADGRQGPDATRHARGRSPA